jgi:hypothetical protein
LGGLLAADGVGFFLFFVIPSGTIELISSTTIAARIDGCAAGP